MAAASLLGVKHATVHPKQNLLDVGAVHEQLAGSWRVGGVTSRAHVRLAKQCEWCLRLNNSPKQACAVAEKPLRLAG